MQKYKDVRLKYIKKHLTKVVHEHWWPQQLKSLGGVWVYAPKIFNQCEVIV